MVAVVAGTGLGLERSSGFVLGGAGQLGQAVLGRGADNVYVNAATGNLVVQNSDEMLFGLGTDSVFDRTYNSHSGGGSWHRSPTRRVTELTGTVNTAGSTVKRISWDGSDVTFTYDAAAGAYIAREGAGGYDRLTFASGVWTWTDGASRQVELYASANGGRITSSRDADGNALTFSYNSGGRLTRVTTQDGGYTDLVWSNGNLVRYETHYREDGVDKTLTRVRYGYDASNRLTSVTVDLSPSDNSITDGRTYVTTYTYHGTSSRIESIRQSDGSRLDVGYAEVGGLFRVSSLSQFFAAGDSPRTTSFSYNTTSRVTTVTDPLGYQTELAYDAKGQLVSVTGPPATAGAPRQVTTFTYNAMGDVTEVRSPDASTVTYTYDGQGNRLSQVDSAGVTVRWTYGSNNQVLTETRYLTPAQGAASASAPATSRFAYDAENHLRFVVGAEGEVIEYLYDAAGNQTSVIRYAGAAFDISALAETASISESALVNWVSTIDRSQANRTDTEYDFRGNVASVTTYSRLLTSGAGDSAGSISKTVYIYDQFGRLLSRQPVSVGQAEVNLYDGLGRLIATTDFAGRTTSFQFNDTASTTVITFANGLTRTSTYNLAGELLSISEAGAGVSTATTAYRYDAAGRLRIATDSTGRSTHTLYDDAGREVARIEPDGALTEYRYDANNRLIATAQYARKLTSTQLASLTDANGNPQDVGLASLRPTADATDRWGWRIYDQADRLIQTIDAAGASTVYSYDGASRLVSTVRHAERIDAASLEAFKSAPPTTLQTPGSVGATATTFTAAATLPPNTAPVSAGDSVTTSQGASVTFDPRANDSDTDNDGLRITDAGPASNGTVTFDGFTVTYEPNPGFIGSDSFSYTVSDGRGGESTATANVTVYSPNEYTALTPGGVFTWYDGDTGLDYTTTVDNNYLGEGHKALILQKSPTAGAPPAYDGSVTLPGSVGVMDAGAAGGDVWAVTPGERLGVAFEALGLGAVTDVSVSMYFWDANWANVGDSTTVTVPVSDWNRIETIITAPANAAFAAIIIEPAAAGDQRSASSFGLAIRKTQFVRLAAGQAMQPWPEGAPANSAPVAAADSVSTTQGTSLTFNPRANDTDADKDPLTVTVSMAPTHGTATANADGTITYKPQTGFTGTDTFTYTVNDQRGGTSTASVTVTVTGTSSNNAPIATDNSVSTPRDVDLTFNPALDDSDLDGDTLTIVDVTQPANGTVERHADGTITYSPNDGYTGPDSFTYTISDGQGGQATATVNVTVTAPQAPASDSDRITRNFYDRSGRLIGVLDAEGYLTETRYDRAGQKIQTSAFANATDADLRTSGTFAQLRSSAGSSANDVHNWFLYDARGFLMAEVNGAGELKRYQYTALGDLEQVTVGQKLDPDALIATPPTLAGLPTPPSGVVLETTRYNRDSLGLVQSEVRTLSSGGSETTTYTYDNMRRLVGTTTAAGTADARTYNQVYDLRGRLIGSLNGEGSAALAALGASPTPAQINDVYARYGVTYAYDEADRMISKTESNGVDAGGSRTLYYYDANGQLTYQINALGEVVLYVYNSFGQVAETIAYGTRVAPATLASLTGGAITPEVTSAITANAALDSATRLEFNQQGLVARRTDALGHVTSYQYNAFGDLTARIDPIDAATTVLTQRTYDRRGLLQTEVKDAASGGLQLASAFGYDAFGRLVQTTDAAGRVRSTEYDRAGRVLSSRDALGQLTSFTYNERGLLFEKTDRTGAKTRYEYTAFSREIRVTTAENITTTTRTNAHGQTIEVIDGAGRRNTWTYDKDGNVRFAYDGANVATESRYDRAGRLEFVIDGAGRSTQYTYDAANRVLTRTVDPGAGKLNLVTRYEYDAKGQQVRVIDPRGSVTQIEYDLNGRKAKVTADALGAKLVTTYAYDQRGRVLTVTEASGSSAQTVTAYKYDKADRLESTRVDSTGLNLTTRYAYDANGNAVAKTDAAGDVTRYVYDDENRLLATVDGAGNVTHNAYDAEGRVASVRRFANVVAPGTLSGLPLAITLAQATISTSANDQLTGHVYDQDGRLAFVVDPNGRLSEYVYDGAGSVTTLTEYAGAIATAASYTLSYVLTEVTSKGLRSSIANRTTRMTYDEAGRRAFSIDATGMLTAYVYDGSGAVTKTVRHAEQYTGSDVSLSTLRTWSNARLDRVRTDRTVYDAAGRAAFTIDAERYATGFVYDASGNVTQKIRYGQQVTAGDATTQAQLASQVDGQSVPAQVLSFAYDGAGRLTDTYDGAGVRTHMVLDAMGRVINKTVAYGTADAATTRMVWDGAGRMTSETRAYGSAEATTTSYSYDGLGRVTAIRDGRGYETMRSYDAVGRMVSEVKPHNDNAPTVTTTYTYDAFGNVTSITDPRGNTGYFYYDKLNRQVMQVDPEGYVTATTHTIGGEVASVTRYYNKGAGFSATTRPTVAAHAKDATTVFERDKLDRLTSIQDAENHTERFHLNAFGDQVVHTNKVGGHSVREFDARGLVVREELFASSSGDPAINTFVYDARGNLTHKTEADGRPEERNTYYVYDLADRVIETRGDAFTALGEDFNAEVTVTPREVNRYDARGNLIEVHVTETGARTLFYYDDLNRKTAQLDAMGALTTYAYDANGNVTQARAYDYWVALPANPGGAPPAPANASAYRQTSYQYDRANRLVATTVAGVRTGHWTGSTYSTQVQDVTTRLEYDAAGNVVREIDGRGNSVWSYYDRRGKKIAQVDQAGYLTSYSLDSEGNVVTEERFATRLTATVGAGSNPATLRSSVQGSDNDRITDYEYDRNGRRLTETRRNVHGWVIADNGTIQAGPHPHPHATVSYQYDGLGNVTRKTEATGESKTYGYDKLGRMIEERGVTYTNRDGHLRTPLKQHQYDMLGNLVRTFEGAVDASLNGRERTTTFTYGAGGRMTSMTDAEGFVRHFRYDAGGRLRLVSYDRLNASAIGASGVNASDVTREGTGYQYDLLGRETVEAQVQWNGVQWSWFEPVHKQYDAHGGITGQGTARKLGDGTYAFPEQNAYDAGGRIWRSTVGDGTVRLFLYDANGNRTLTISSAGADISAWTLDGAIAALTNNGQSAIGDYPVAGVVVTIEAYDQRGQQVETREPLRETGRHTTLSTIRHTRTYNAFGEVSTQTNALGGVTEYTYTTHGKVRTSRDVGKQFLDVNGVSGNAPQEIFFHDASGRLVAHQNSRAHITSWRYHAGTGYDGSEGLITVQFNPDGGKRQSFYSVFNNKRWYIDELGPTEDAHSNRSRVIEYNYDKMGRLTALIQPARVHEGQPVELYFYDGLGQRIAHKRTDRWVDGGEHRIQRTYYDHAGRVTEVKDFGGEVTRYAYVWSDLIVTSGLGQFGGLIKHTTRHAETSDAITSTVREDYFGRTVGRTDDAGNIYTMLFDAAGRLVDQESKGSISSWGNGHRSLYSYYNTGLVRKYEDLDGRTGNFAYDVGGNLVFEDLHVPPFAGAAVEVHKSANAEYDAFGRRTRLTDTGPDGRELRLNFSYTAMDDIRRVEGEYQDTNGYWQNLDRWFHYDEANRLTIHNGALVGGTVQRGTNGVKITYDLAGQRKTAEMAGADGLVRTETYDYHVDGHLWRVKTDDGILRSVNYRNVFGQITRHYEFDKQGGEDYLNGIGGPVPIFLRENISYDERGRVVSERQQVRDVENSAAYVMSDITNTYAGPGRLLSSSRVENLTKGITTTTSYEYQKVDGYRQTVITKRTVGSDLDHTETSQLWYDAQGQLRYVAVPDYKPREQHYVWDATGQLVSRKEVPRSGELGPVDYTYNFGGVRVGSTSNNGTLDLDYRSFSASRVTRGDSLFRNGAPKQHADFGSTFEPVNPLSRGEADSWGRFTVAEGDTLSSIALAIYGDANLWWVLADANGLNGSEHLAAGRVLIVPAKVVNTHNKSTTFRAFDPGRVLGNVEPTQGPPASALQKKKKRSFWDKLKQFVVAFIAVVVAYVVAPYFAAGFSNFFSTGSFLASKSAIAAGAAATGTTVANGTFVVGLGAKMAGGAVAGMAGSVAGQLVGMATGLQSKFDWKGLGMAAVSGAVFGGLQARGPLVGDGVLKTAVRAGASSAISQGIGVATGLQDRFDWSGVGIAAISAGAGRAIGQRLSDHGIAGLQLDARDWRHGALANTGGAVAGAAAASLINGSDFGDNLLRRLPDVIGATVGSALSGRLMERQAQSAASARVKNGTDPIGDLLDDIGRTGAQAFHGDSAAPGAGFYERRDGRRDFNRYLVAPDDATFVGAEAAPPDFESEVVVVTGRPRARNFFERWILDPAHRFIDGIRNVGWSVDFSYSGDARSDWAELSSHIGRDTLQRLEGRRGGGDYYGLRGPAPLSGQALVQNRSAQAQFKRAVAQNLPNDPAQMVLVGGALAPVIAPVLLESSLAAGAWATRGILSAAARAELALPGAAGKAYTGTAIAGEAITGVGLGGAPIVGAKLLAARSGIDAAESAAPEFVTVFRGDRAGTTIIKSNAAREGGYASSQRIIDSNNLDDLFRSHALDSSSPPSPFISVTTDPAVARYFAGPTGVVNEFRIPVSRATANPFNNYVVPAGPGGRLIPEAELLVPNYIRPSEFVRRR